MHYFDHDEDEKFSSAELFAVHSPADPAKQFTAPIPSQSIPSLPGIQDPQSAPLGSPTFVGPLYASVPAAPPPPPRYAKHHSGRAALVLLICLGLGVLGAFFALGVAMYRTVFPETSFSGDSLNIGSLTSVPTANIPTSVGVNVTPFPTSSLPTRIPTTLPPTAQPGQPTTTPIPYAASAEIAFTRSTQGFTVPAQFAAAPHGGAITSSVFIASVSRYPSPALPAAYTPGLGVTFAVTIHNHCACREVSQNGWTIHNIAQGLTCTLQGTVIMAPGMSGQQSCVTRPGRVGQTQWDDTTSHAPLEYIGANGPGGKDAFYSVPTNCATASLPAAENTAQAALAQKLASDAGGTVFSGPSYSFANASCSPVAGTTQAAAFTYVVLVDGTGQEATYNPADAIAYQQQQIAAHVAALGNPWYAASSSICSAPSATATSATTATITCPASGVATWNWSTAYEASVAQLIAGESVANAAATLRATPGVAGNISIQLQGGSVLPQDPAQIHLQPS